MNNRVTSDVGPKFSLVYTNIYVGMPERDDHGGGGGGGGAWDRPITPQECRLRDMTYFAPVFVDIEYPQGSKRTKRARVMLARLPTMLRSNRCMLSGKSEA